MFKTLFSYGVLVLTLVTFGSSISSFASEANPLSAYKQKSEITTENLDILNRYFVSTDKNLNRGYAIADGNTIIPSSIATTYENIQNPVEIKTITPVNGKIQDIMDGRTDNKVEFEPVDGKSEFILSYQKPISTKLFKYNYSENVLKSQSLEITLIDGEQNKSVYDKVFNVNGYAAFPETLGSNYKITFYHSKRLQLSEVGFDYPQGEVKFNSRIEWLGEPGKKYTLFYEPEESTLSLYDNRLSKATDKPIEAKLEESKSNDLFTEQDTDNDGVPDVRDNCKDQPNPEQVDVDKNNIADICEDRDLDSVVDFNDKCIVSAKPEDVGVDGCKKTILPDNTRWLIPVGFGIALLTMAGVVFFSNRNKEVAVVNKTKKSTKVENKVRTPKKKTVSSTTRKTNVKKRK
jgi:hypothetical protein